jgi:hypothetical protein
MKYTNIEIPCYFRILPFVVRAENQYVCCGSDLESRTDLRNELDFEVLSETYPENGHYL